MQEINIKRDWENESTAYLIYDHALNCKFHILYEHKKDKACYALGRGYSMIDKRLLSVE